jgi:hypothetical protein
LPLQAKQTFNSPADEFSEPIWCEVFNTARKRPLFLEVFVNVESRVLQFFLGSSKLLVLRETKPQSQSLYNTYLLSLVILFLLSS